LVKASQRVIDRLHRRWHTAFESRFERRDVGGAARVPYESELLGHVSFRARLASRIWLDEILAGFL